MGGGGASGRELDQTPTWAVAVVVALIILISIALEKVLHTVGEIFEHKKRRLYMRLLRKLKAHCFFVAELMVLGFISLLLTFGQSYISRICIPEEVADTMLFCPKNYGHGDGHGNGHGEDHGNDHGHGDDHGNHKGDSEEHHRRLLLYDDARRFLSGAESASACDKGYVPLISVHALHQLHIFIFFLAVFHVLYSATTMMLGRLKTRGWKEWERECINSLNELNDPSRFRLTHETSFVRDHTRGAWTKTKFTFYFVCLWRQFFRSVRKADYCTMRHGFVSVHLTPESKFDFQKYIKKSLEDDFKVVVGITPALWGMAVLFLLFDVHGWHVMTFMGMIPLVVTLAVGTKLQAIIAQMALEIVEKHAVIQGMPLVSVTDEHFWFGWPPLVLHLIHFVLFQNAFEITYFFWIWYEFGLRSCFHEDFTLITVRVCLGVLVQFMCSYITLPLYALVTQMGSTMKRSIFDEQTSKALKQWHKKAAQKKGDHGHGKTVTSPHKKKLGENGADGASAGTGSGDAGHQDPNAEGKTRSNTNV